MPRRKMINRRGDYRYQAVVKVVGFGNYLGTYKTWDEAKEVENAYKEANQHFIEADRARAKEERSQEALYKKATSGR